MAKKQTEEQRQINQAKRIGKFLDKEMGNGTQYILVIKQDTEQQTTTGYVSNIVDNVTFLGCLEVIKADYTNPIHPPKHTNQENLV